ncbi:MAG: type II toxin-antitoxin system PemK/MazF family toxin [Candidatus Wallbacteria bacterium]|nr:type II toxin-antitoxin system PemK/MazF family toxin [Candidatus Wallbacteria bacterium]
MQRQPARGEIWFVEFDPVRGREQAGKRPCLVFSVDKFNSGPAELVVVLPVTTRDKRIPFHVRVEPPEAGLKQPSFVKCEDIRSISKLRLDRCWGAVSAVTMQAVEYRLRILLGL